MDEAAVDAVSSGRGAHRKWRIGGILALGILLLAAGAVGFAPRWLLGWAVHRERQAAGLEARRATVGDHDIAYLDGGDGEAVLLLHGFGADKDNWTRFAGALTRRYRVVAPDLPGFGASTYIPGASYRVADQAHRVAAWADALGIDRFHLAGNSMGGQIAGQLAVLYPERVLSLILIDCTGVKSPTTAEMEVAIRRGEANPLVVGSLTDFDTRMSYLFVRPPEIPGFIKRVLVGQARDRRQAHEAILAQTTPEVEALEPDLGRISARTLIVWGERDRMRHASSVAVLQRGIADASAVILPDCGHVPMSERPEETAAHVLRFLADLAPR